MSSGKTQKEIAKYREKRTSKPACAVSDAEILIRLRFVEKQLLDGKRGGQILDMIKKKLKVDISFSTLQKYMRQIKDKWEIEDAMLRPLWRERQIRQLHDVADEIKKERAWGHWINAQKLIADIEGNLAPTKVDVTHHDEFDGWSLQELKDFVKSDGQIVPQNLVAKNRGNGSSGKTWSGEEEEVKAEEETIH